MLARIESAAQAAVVVAVLAAATPVRAGDLTPTPAAIPDPADLSEDVKRAASLGEELFQLDQLARVATELLRDARLPLDGVDGWLVSRDARGWVVLMANAEPHPRLVYVVSLPSGAPPRLERMDPPEKLGPGLAEMFLGIRLARARVGGAREKTPIVLTGDAIGRRGILVYVFTESENADEIVLGPHMRVLLGLDGRSVQAATPLSVSLGSVSRVEIESASGKDAPGFTVQGLEDAPNEGHVYLSLHHGRIPITVRTLRGSWRVEGNEIQLLGAAEKR